MVRLASGEDILADAVLVAVGAAPETGWLQGNGLDLTDGVLCDEHCAVIGAHSVVACGDVARWFNPLLGQRMRVEHWANAIEQGRHAARRMLGLHASTGFSSVPYFWSDQADLKLQMVGSSAGHDEVVIRERGAKRLVVEYHSQQGLLAVTLSIAMAVLVATWFHIHGQAERAAAATASRIAAVVARDTAQEIESLDVLVIEAKEIGRSRHLDATA